MESETPQLGGVKGDDAKIGAENPDGFPREIPSVESENLCRRFDGYLRATFENNKPYEQAARFKEKFAKRTGYSWKHVNDTFTAFSRWSTNFTFKRERIRRSTCILIRPRHRGHVLTTAEVRRRLVAWIRVCALNSARPPMESVVNDGKFVGPSPGWRPGRGRRGCGVHVDRAFLSKFWERTQVDPLQIFYAWRSLKQIPGMRARWRGRGNGVNLHVEQSLQHGDISLPENAGGISLPTGGRDKKTATPGRRDSDRFSGSLREQPGEGGGGSSALRAALADGSQSDKLERPGFPHGGDGQIAPPARPPQGACKPATNSREFYRWKPARAPFLVGDHWIAPGRLKPKANFLGFVALQRLHADFPRVKFRPTTTPNFALEALLEGFLDSEICAAYRVGLEEAQNSAQRDRAAAAERDPWGARDRDRAGEFLREPSQVVARAWLRLRGDGRTVEARWAAIFSGAAKPQRVFVDLPPPAPRSRVAKPRAPDPAPKPPSDFVLRDGSSVRLDKLPETTPAALRAMAADADAAPGELRTLEAYLRARRLTLADMLKSPRGEQQEIVRSFHAWQKRPRET